MAAKLRLNVIRWESKCAEFRTLDVGSSVEYSNMWYNVDIGI